MKLPLSVALTVVGVVGTAGILLIALSKNIPPAEFAEMILFILLIATASFPQAQNPAGGVVSSATSLLYVSIYVFKPITALLVVSLGYGIGNALPRSWVTWRAFFNGAQMGTAVLVGGIVYRNLGGDPTSSNLSSQILPILLGAFALQLANNFFISLIVSKTRKVSFLQTWISFVREFIWPNLLSIPTSVLIAILYVRLHEAFVLVFLLVLPFHRWAVQLVLEERMTYMRIIESLVRAWEFGFPGMRGHARRVADLSMAIGRGMGLVENDIEALEYAALMHDIGMIGLEDELSSPDANSRTERLIGDHVRLGAEIVSELPRRDVREMILNHHARYQPRGGEDARLRKRMSVGARILALAEDVDSRLYGLFPYRRAHTMNEVVESVVVGRGSVYDPEVVDVFLSVRAGASEVDDETSLGELRGVESGGS